MVGKILIERIARIPVEVEIASEFRYRDPIVDENTVVLAISQSGETADTLAAMEEAQQGRHAVVDRQCHRLAGHAHRRRLHLDADRPGDWRGLDQGLHRAAGGSVHAGRVAGRPARHDHAEAAHGTGGRPAPGARPGGALPGPRGRGGRVAQVLKDTRDCSTWGAASTCPLPTKAR